MSITKAESSVKRIPVKKRKDAEKERDKKSTQLRSRGRFIASRKSTLLHEVCRQLAKLTEMRHQSSRIDFEGEGGVSALEARGRILNLDGKCEYCEHRAAVTVDHFYPLVKCRRPSGYCNDEWNSIPCCRECNSSKGGNTYHEWLTRMFFPDEGGGRNTKRYTLSSIYSDGRIHEKNVSDESHEDRASRVQEKFRKYDELFRQNCLRIPHLDEGWWQSTKTSIDSFLEDMQTRVDTYFEDRTK